MAVRVLLGIVVGTTLVLAAACSVVDGFVDGDDDEADVVVVIETPTTVAADVFDVVGHDLETKTMADGDTERAYWLFRPTSLDQTSPAPLVVSLHGRASNGETVSRLGFNDVAEREGIVVAYPSAIDGVWDLEGTTDVEFLAALVFEVSSATWIDPDRVYVVGYGMGGSMASLAACRLPDQPAAVASVAMVDHRDPPACSTPRPARVLSVVGERDRIYSIDGGLTDDDGFVDPPGPLEEEATAWAATNGCELDYEEQPLADGVVRREYPCRSGALVVYVHPGGHVWAMGPPAGLDTNEVVWEFLGQYTEPIDPG